MKKIAYAIMIFFAGALFLAGCVNQTDSGTCSGFFGDDAKNECFIRLAMNTSNLEYCENAVSTLNYWFGKADCYYSVAKQKNDSTICMQAKEELTRDQCMLGFANETGNDALCGTMTTSVKNACYLTLAVKNKDETLCDKIDPDTNASDTCFDQLAIQKNDETLCTKIKNSTERELCGVAFCDEMDFECITSKIEPTQYKDPYLLALESDRDLLESVKENKDSAMCGQFSYYKNAEECKKTDSPQYSGYCVNAMPLVLTCYRYADTLNQSVCDSFFDATTQVDCIKEWAKQENDESTCEKITIQGDLTRLNRRLGIGEINSRKAQIYADYMDLSKAECVSGVQYQNPNN